MIIYPPLIADTIPGFTQEKVTIPFTQNTAVGVGEIGGFSLVVKEYVDSKLVATLNKQITKETDVDKIVQTGEVTFSFGSWKPVSGNYYKFQLSYIDKELSSYRAFSIVSIGRCIGSEAGITLSAISGQCNENGWNYKYETNIISEPLYSYRFVVLLKSTGYIIQDTGVILHNASNDTVGNGKRVTRLSFPIKHKLVSGQEYTAKCYITTVNKYSKSISHTFKPSNSSSNMEASLVASQDTKASKEEGYINLSVVVNGKTKVPSGNYSIERRKLNDTKWEVLVNFTSNGSKLVSECSWVDCTVEQGVYYIYALRAHVINANGSIIHGPAKEIVAPIVAEFEYSYLMSGNRQFKIKYNPKISNLKTTTLEQKTDTIGSKYPFFFRNSEIGYKEFQISGLLSYLGDENVSFASENEIGMLIDKTHTRTGLYSPSLTSDNIFIERNFKLKMLEWLNDGKPKLFRSPTEGNYIVRLMNISLTPNDQLGRMTHNFSSTAYEIQDYDIEQALNDGIITIPNITLSKQSAQLDSENGFILNKNVMEG